MRILFIEDEKRIASFVDKGLRAEGYTTMLAEDGEEGSHLALVEDFDLVILDLLLPRKDGFTVLREIRQQKPTLPVIILTAKDDLESKVKGLDLGADDYLVKPFAFEELTARIRAKLRSSQEGAAILKVGQLQLDLKTKEVKYGQEKISLQAKEFALLEFLLRHPNQVLSRIQILNNVWEYDFDPESNIVDVYIRYLRQKLLAISGKPFIETVRGMGYRVAED